MITTMAVSCNRPMQTSKQQLLLLAGKHTSLLRQHLFFAATSSRQGVKLVKGSFDKWSDRSTFNVISFFLVNRLMSGLIIATTQITYGFFFSKNSYDFAFGFAITPSNNGITKIEHCLYGKTEFSTMSDCALVGWVDLWKVYWWTVSDPRQDHNSMKLAGL